jgi:DNA-directed RNA polymerase subunit RPC12/RpoP
MKKMKCSHCGRRAFDISDLPKEQVEVSLKCPQCGKLVSVPCDEKSEIKVCKRLDR